MTNWLPTIARSGSPLYVEIADAIEADIQNGALVPGAKLPPLRNIAFDIGVTVGTVSRAYALACERGLVSGEVGRGTYVREHENTLDSIDFTGEYPRQLDADANIATSPEGKPIFNFDRSSAVDVGQTAIIAEVAGRIADGHPSKLMDYIHVVPDHWREAGCEWLKTGGWRPEPESIIPTSGVHAAIVSIVTALTVPGDKIAFENLSYSSVARSCALLGRRIVQLEFDEFGAVPESFEKLCAQQHPKILYLMASIQNPTLACIPEERRKEICDIARRYNVWIIDDAVYAPLVDDENQPFAALAPERTFTVGGFSKSVSAGIRSGWCACPPRLSERIANAHKMVTGGASYWLTEVASTLVLNGEAHRIRQKVKVENRQRTVLFQATMISHDYRFHRHCPYVWMRLPDPWTSGTFKSALMANGIIVSNEDEFKPARTDKIFHGVRIGFTAVKRREKLAAPFGIIADILESGIAGYDKQA